APRERILVAPASGGEEREETFVSLLEIGLRESGPIAADVGAVQGRVVASVGEEDGLLRKRRIRRDLALALARGIARAPVEDDAKDGHVVIDGIVRRDVPPVLREGGAPRADRDARGSERCERLIRGTDERVPDTFGVLVDLAKVG